MLTATPDLQISNLKNNKLIKIRKVQIYKLQVYFIVSASPDLKEVP